VPTVAPVPFTQDHPKDVVAVEQVFSAYVYYIDSHQLENLANLFLEDGVDDHYNNIGGVVTPVNNGVGCAMTGHVQMIQYWARQNGTCAALPDPGEAHHVVTSKLIHVEGDTATMKAVWFRGSTTNGVSGAPNTVSYGTTGEYDNIFKRTRDGWKIARDRVIFDGPTTISYCNGEGVIPADALPCSVP